MGEMTFWQYLLASIGVVAAQEGLNLFNMDKQNTHNLDVYEKYNTPLAQAEQLKAAGVSDAGIGQALTGHQGASIDLTSAPMQPNNMTDAINSMTNMFNDTRRVENETTYNKAAVANLFQDFEIKGWKLKECEATFDNLVNKSFFDVEKLKSDIDKNKSDIKKNESDIAVNESQVEVNKAEETLKKNQADLVSHEALIKEIESIYTVEFNDQQLEHLRKLNEELDGKIELIQSQLGLDKAQAAMFRANIVYLMAEATAIGEMKDVRKREAAEARFYNQFLVDHGKPYEVRLNRWKIGTEIFGSTIKAVGMAFGIASMKAPKMTPIGFKTY